MFVEVDGALYPEERTIVESRALRGLADFQSGLHRIAVRVRRTPDRGRSVSVLVVTRGFRCVVETATAKTLPASIDRCLERVRASVATVLGVAQPRRRTLRAPRESMVVPPSSAVMRIGVPTQPAANDTALSA